MGDFLELPAVEAEIVALIAKFPGWEPESLRLQPAMVPVTKLHEWCYALRAHLASVEREAAFVAAAKEYARLMTRDARNASDPAKVGADIDKARGTFYAAYGALALEREP